MTRWRGHGDILDWNGCCTHRLLLLNSCCYFWWHHYRYGYDIPTGQPCINNALHGHGWTLSKWSTLGRWNVQIFFRLGESLNSFAGILNLQKNPGVIYFNYWYGFNLGTGNALNCYTCIKWNQACFFNDFLMRFHVYVTQETCYRFRWYLHEITTTMYFIHTVNLINNAGVHHVDFRVWQSWGTRREGVLTWNRILFSALTLAFSERVFVNSMKTSLSVVCWTS